MALVFASHRQFEATCKGFIEMQSHFGMDVKEQASLPHVQSGWTWREHPVSTPLHAYAPFETNESLSSVGLPATGIYV